MRRGLLVLALVMGVVSAFASEANAGPSAGRNAGSSDVRDNVRALLDEFRKANGFPGVTAAYALPDGSIEALAVGLADVEGDIPMTRQSRMLAASIGKSIWGALVLSLETEDLLSRSDAVSKHLGHLPWFERVANADTMTVGHLLTHSAGVPDHVHMEGIADALMNLGHIGPFEPSAAVAFVLDEPPLFEAGTGWSYSDTGYLLLGMVIEAASRQDVFDLAQERFTRPLGLAHTMPSDSAAIAGLAVGYTANSNPFGLPPRTMNDDGILVWNPVIEWTGGGFVSTSADLVLWGHALFTGRVMDTPYLDRLLEGVPVEPDATGAFYGSGIAIYEDTLRGLVYGHGGWVPGYVSSLRHYADHRLTIAFQINSDIGVVDSSTDLVSSLEAELADLLLSSMEQ